MTKTEAFKSVIKKAVKEAIHEELKDILLEAMRGNRVTISEDSNEQREIKSNNNGTKPASRHIKELFNNKEKFSEILNETKEQMHPTSVREYRPGSSNVNADLGDGEISLDQITNLVGKKH